MPDKDYSPLCNDIRLKDAYTKIAHGEIALLSLDIFDTLLWRKLPFPEDLFLLLGKKLKEEGWLIPAVTAEIFAQLRAAAEKKIRNEKKFHQGTGEVTLTEIYWQLKELFIPLTTEEMLNGALVGVYESDVNPLVKKELTLEKMWTQWDLEVQRLLTFAQAKGIFTILVSDTYFEQEEIRYLLADNQEIVASLSKVYLSSEHSCSKSEGLFRIVLHDFNLPPEKILHLGDHKERDVAAAKQFGIQTILYQKCTPKFEDVLEREWSDEPHKRADFLDARYGDFGFTSLRSKICYHKAPLYLKKEEQFYWQYGATVLGPILFGFIHWVYARCFAMSEKNVFCLMREGKLYASLIEKFAPCFPQHRLAAKKLWVSRLFITHASMAHGYQRELMATMNAFLDEFTIESFCTYLGLDITKLPRWSKDRHVMLEDKTLRNEFIFYLIKNRNLHNRITEVAAAKRQRFINYLKNLEDLTEPKKMVLVDVGWNGSAQGAMQQILDVYGAQVRLHGLYIGTTESTNLALLNGVVREGYLFKGGYPPCGNAHKKGCYVLEQTATAETGLGPLQDIDEQGNIITNPFRIPLKQKRQAEIVQHGIFTFFDFASSYVQSGAVTLDAHSPALQEQLRNIFLRSMVNTTQEEAIKFGHWLHEHGPAANLIQVIGKNNYYENYIKDMLPIAAFKEKGLNWPAAYAAKKSKYLTLMSQAMWLQTVPPECFLSEDAYSLRIFIDRGKNFSKRATQHILLRSNPNRHFYTLAELFSAKKGMRRIQLQFTLPSALIRIKSLRMIAFDKKSPKPKHMTFFENQSNSRRPLACLAGKAVDENTFYCDQGLKFLYEFEEKEIYQLKIKLCCEIFKTASSDAKALESRKSGPFLAMEPD